MAKTWKVQEAKAQFSALLDRCEVEGPQVVTRRGVETAVVVPIAEWRRLRRPRYKDIKAWLLAEDARGDIPIPSRRGVRLRTATDFDDD